MLNPKIQTGTKVVFNDLPDATVFTVIDRDALTVTVVEAEGYAPQVIDASLCKPAREDHQ